MSSEIFYDRAFIRVGEKFVPLCNHGSSNCFDISINGREIPEKYWSVLNYPYPGRFVFDRSEMQHLSEVYEEASTSNRGGTRKSRYTSFEPGEFGRWILGGMRRAYTVEEYTAYGNTLLVTDYDDQYRRYTVGTTAELLTKLEELSGKSVGISFMNNRQVQRPPSRAKGSPFDFNTLDQYYVLYGDQGYFVKRSSRKIWVIKGRSSVPEQARKFKSRLDAQRYLERNSRFFKDYSFEIRCVEKGAVQA